MHIPRLSLRSTRGSSARRTALAPRLAARRGTCVGYPRLASDSFPILACGGGQLARAFRFALGLLHALACTLELFFRNAYALLGDLCLQPRTLDGLSRRCSVGRRARSWRCFRAARLFHLLPEASGGRVQSHICGKPLPPRSTPALPLRRVAYPQ